MNIITSTANAISSTMDGITGTIEGLAHEATQWSRRRDITQELRDEQYINEALVELDKSNKRFTKANISEDLLKRKKTLLAKLK